MVYGTFSFRT